MNKEKIAFESSAILQKAFLKLKASDGFSVRKWSGLVGISPATLNLILNSKRLAPKKHLKELADSLDFDAVSLDKLQKAHTRDWILLKGYGEANAKSIPASEAPDLNEITEDDSVLLKSWLHLALLEFVTCDNFREDTAYIAAKFKVAPRAVILALADLEKAEYIIRKGGHWTKSHQKMRIPTKRSREIIREYHLQTLTKVMEHLRSAKDQDSFERRLITGYTVAVNPAQVAKIKLALEKALIEACSSLSEGECTEVYQLQLQLFPYTRKD